MKIDGFAYAPDSAQKHPAYIELNNSDSLSCYGQHSIYSGLLAPVQQMPKVGRSPSTLVFPSGWSFTFEHHPEFEQWWAKHKQADVLGRWERKPSLIALAIIFSVVFIYSVIRYGFPAITNNIAQQVPESVYIHMGDQTRQWLDDTHWLSPSALPPWQQAALHAKFAQLAQTQASPRPLRLVIKSWPDTENAFAVVDGTIIITDALVRRLDDPALVEAVLLHEIGHIHYNHGMQRLVKSSLLAFISAYAIGDIGALAESMVSLASAAMIMQYSQQDEIAADLFSAHYLKQQHGNPQAMIDALLAIEQVSESDAQASQKAEAQTDVEALSEQLGRWFSSHPQIQERIKAIEQQVKSSN